MGNKYYVEAQDAFEANLIFDVLREYGIGREVNDPRGYAYPCHITVNMDDNRWYWGVDDDGNLCDSVDEIIQKITCCKYELILPCRIDVMSEDDGIKVLEYLDERGYTWFSGARLLRDTSSKNNFLTSAELGYAYLSIRENKGVCYGTLSSITESDEKKWKVVYDVPFLLGDRIRQAEFQDINVLF